MAGLDLDDAVADVPSSAKLVYLALRESGPARATELAADLGMHQRTVYESLRTLREADVVERYPDVGDARRSLYCLSHVRE